jgi:DNA-binding MurR/RpiR family transcriptional regulator
VKLELSQTYATPSEEEGVHSKVQMLVAKDRTNLEKALAHNTLETIENILDMLRAAPRIVVTGESYAEPIAESFAHMLRDAGLPVIYAGGDVYERASALAHLVRKEVIIGMTPVEGPSGVAKVLRYARQQGALTLACTPSLSSQAARASEHLLYAPGETEGTLLSLTGLYAICMAIAQAITLMQPEAAVKRNAAIARALEELA